MQTALGHAATRAVGMAVAWCAMVAVAWCCLPLSAQPQGEATHYTLNTANGLRDNRVLQMCQLADGRIVAYSGGAVDVYDGQGFMSVDMDGAQWLPLPNYDGHTHLYVDSIDRLWVKEHRRLACVDLRTMRPRADVEAMVGRSAADFFVDKRRRAWVVRSDSVVLLSSGRGFRLPQGGGRLQDIEAVGESVYAFMHTGEVAEYGGAGLVESRPSPFVGDEWRDFAATSLVVSVADTVLYQVRTGRGGAVLMAYDVARARWRRLMQSPQPMHTLAATPSGTLYVTLPDGYMSINPATGVRQKHSALRLPDGTHLDTGINTVLVDRQGGVWLGTYSSGMLYTSPFSGLFDTNPIDISVSPILTSVYLHSEALRAGRAYGGRVLIDVAPPYIDHLVLDHDQNAIAFRFSTMNYVRPRSTCYRYRCSADGGVWRTVEAGGGGSPVDDRGSLYLPFVGLSPGDYTLEVMASTNAGHWEDCDVRRIQFTVRPPWWLTATALAAYALVAMALVGAAFVAHGRHVRSVERRKAREEELMGRIRTLTERLGASGSGGSVVLGEAATSSALPPALTAAEAEFVSRVTAMVKRNMAMQGYSVEQLSRDLCMERTGLYRKLTALLDKSPVAFIRSIRLQRASEMLAEGGMTVAEVAEATGFGSVGYFSKCFQAEFGCRPSDYPKRQ